MNSSQHTHLTDQEILKHFYASHNNEWLGFLLERYTMLLYGVCMKYLKNPEEARDAVQQIFLKAITELHKYEVTYFSSWLYMIAKNHCLMLLRSKKYEVSVESINEPAEETKISDPLKNEKLLKEMLEAIEHLNDLQKICIRKCYLDKKTYQTISAETGFTLLQVKSHIQNGKRNLRLLLADKMDKFED